MDGAGNEPVGPRVLDVAVAPMEDGYHPITLMTGRGKVHCRHYPVGDAKRAAVWVGGIGGNWDTPARGLYPRLCLELMDEGISSLRVRYRYPTKLEESTFDVLAGIEYLEGNGAAVAAMTGHSFGGAVAILAGASCPITRTVVTLATQSYGTRPVANLSPGCSILLVHGAADVILTPAASKYVYALAHEPKRLVILEGAGHNLDEQAAEVHDTVRTWIVDELGDAAV